MEKIKKLFALVFNKETILYVICGVMTTIVNLVSLKIFTLLLGEKLYLLTNTFAWIIAVVFAFVVNKLLVFESKSWKGNVIGKEISTFLTARIASYFIEEGGLWLFMSPLKFEDRVFDFWIVKLSGLMVAKLIVAVVVVLLNYILSKFVIFKKPKEENQEIEPENIEN